MCTCPVVMRVSTATRLRGSCSSIASRIESLIWSAILSGWPSVTDSEVKRRRGTRFSLRSVAARGARVRLVGGPTAEVTGADRQPSRVCSGVWTCGAAEGSARRGGGGGDRVPDGRRDDVLAAGRDGGGGAVGGEH